MSNLKVNSKSPTSSDSSGVYYYNTSSPVYSGGEWPFWINNSNDLDITTLNYTASTYYRQNVHDIGLDFNASDGVIDWDEYKNKILNRTIPSPNLDTLFNDALGKASPESDQYGNPMCDIPVKFSAKGYGTVTISAIEIGYDYTARVPDFSLALDSYLDFLGRPNRDVLVPVAVNASSAGTLLLSNLDVLVDTPPRLNRTIPDFAILEEGDNPFLAELSDYFTNDNADDFDSQPLTFEMADNTNSTHVRVTIGNGRLGAEALTLNWSGRTDVRIRANDSRNQSVLSDWFAIIVQEVNDPPVIVSVPPDSAEVGRLFTYQVVVIHDENDTNTRLFYNLTGAPSGMSISSTGNLTWRPDREFAWQTMNLTVKVSDGELFALQNLSIQVNSTNKAPVIEPAAIPSAYAGYLFQFKIIATDAENDPLAYSFYDFPAGMTIDPASGLISWPSPTLESGADNSTYNVGVAVSDGINSTAYLYRLKVVKYQFPVVNITPPNKVTAGELYSYRLEAFDPQGLPLQFSLVTPITGMNVSADGWINWTPDDSQKGNNHITIRISDELNSTLFSFDIEVAEKGAAGSYWLWLLLVVMVVAVCAVGAGLYVRMRRKDALLKERWPEMPSKKPEPHPVTIIEPMAPEKPGAPPSGQKPAAAFTGAGGAPREKLDTGIAPGTRVQDIFIIYRDGRLIHHLTNRLTPLDHEIFASMFSSVQEFMKDSMGAERIDSIKYEEYNIIMEKGKNINLAVVLTGDEPPDIRQVIKTSIADVELVCARLLEKWDGDAAPLKKDLELLLKPISETVRTSKSDKKAKAKNPEEYVTVLSGVEFYRGYVKVKMEVKNDLDNVITDAMVKIIVKQDALRISHLEPANYKLEGDSIIIGNVQPGETVQLNLYLDPLVCTGSFVDATLTFKDARGMLYSIVMNRRKAEVVCPMFHTDEDINVAVLRKMISEFQQHDSKVYNLPEGLWAEEAFAIGMSVIEAHNVRLVRDFTETKPAFSAEAWYYGRTQIKKEQVVMRISVSRESNTLEFFVGSSDLAAITGLLAEFGHELNRRLKNKGIIQQTIKHLDLTEKDRVARKSQLLLHRYSEAEAGVEESEPKK